MSRSKIQTLTAVATAVLLIGHGVFALPVDTCGCKSVNSPDNHATTCCSVGTACCGARSGECMAAKHGGVHRDREATRCRCSCGQQQDAAPLACAEQATSPRVNCLATAAVDDPPLAIAAGSLTAALLAQVAVTGAAGADSLIRLVELNPRRSRVV